MTHPSPKRVRHRMWAQRLASEEYDFDYPYTPEQRARVERRFKERVDWVGDARPATSPRLVRGERLEAHTPWTDSRARVR